MNETMIATCPSCQAQFEVSSTFAGKQGKCPQCQSVFTIGGGSQAAPPPQQQFPPQAGPPQQQFPPQAGAPPQQQFPPQPGPYGGQPYPGAPGMPGQPMAGGTDHNMFGWYRVVLTKYADFSGRARRKEYWYFALVNVIANIVLAVADMLIGFEISPGLGILRLVYTLAVFIPSLAVAVRRLHDTGRSGWWFLIVLVPLAGIILLVFIVQDSEQAPNRYGPNPKTI